MSFQPFEKSLITISQGTMLPVSPIVGLKILCNAFALLMHSSFLRQASGCCHRKRFGSGTNKARKTVFADSTDKKLLSNVHSAISVNYELNILQKGFTE